MEKISDVKINVIKDRLSGQMIIVSLLVTQFILIAWLTIRIQTLSAAVNDLENASLMQNQISDIDITSLKLLLDETDSRRKREINEDSSQQLSTVEIDKSILNSEEYDDNIKYPKSFVRNESKNLRKYVIRSDPTTAAPISERKSRVMQTRTEKKPRNSKLRTPYDGSYFGSRYEELTSGARETISKDVVDERSERFKVRHKPRPRQPVKYEDFDSREQLCPSFCNMAAVHYFGDTSNYTIGVHKHYEGNGRLKGLSNTYTDWKPSHWSHTLKMNEKFHLHQGNVTVYEPGLYLVYSQIHYSEVHDTNGFSIMKNDEPIGQCILMTSSSSNSQIKSNTCYTSVVIYLHSKDKISIHDIHRQRHAILKKEKSYFGLIKLSNINIQE